MGSDRHMEQMGRALTFQDSEMVTFTVDETVGEVNTLKLHDAHRDCLEAQKKGDVNATEHHSKIIMELELATERSRVLNRGQSAAEIQKRHQNRINVAWKAKEESQNALERLKQAAERFYGRLLRSTETWHASRGQTAKPDVHTRGYYAERLLETAARVTALSRKAESASMSNDHAGAKEAMTAMDEQVGDMALLLMLLVERQRSLVAEKIAERMTNRGRDR
jgi:hypothetical protein